MSGRKRTRRPESRIGYQFVDSSPEEIERRLDRAFAVVFEEAIRIRTEDAIAKLSKAKAAVHEKYN